MAVGEDGAVDDTAARAVIGVIAAAEKDCAIGIALDDAGVDDGAVVAAAGLDRADPGNVDDRPRIGDLVDAVVALHRVVKTAADDARVDEDVFRPGSTGAK